MERAFRAIRRSDVVALVIDAVDGITQQDFRCAIVADACICGWPCRPIVQSYSSTAYGSDLHVSLASVASQIVPPQLLLCRLRSGLRARAMNTSAGWLSSLQRRGVHVW